MTTIKNKSSSFIITSQHDFIYRYKFPTNFRRCCGVRVDALYINNIVSSGSRLSLYCPQLIANGPDQLPRIEDLSVPTIWNQAYPLPARSNQIPSHIIWFEELRDISYLDLQLISDGVLSTAEGALNATWLFTLYFDNCCPECGHCKSMCSCCSSVKKIDYFQ